jgi:hypothetical protein
MSRANLGRAVQAYRAHLEQRPRRVDRLYLDRLAQRLAVAADLARPGAKAGHGAGDTLPRPAQGGRKSFFVMAITARAQPSR